MVYQVKVEEDPPPSDQDSLTRMRLSWGGSMQTPKEENSKFPQEMDSGISQAAVPKLWLVQAVQAQVNFAETSKNTSPDRATSQTQRCHSVCESSYCLTATSWHSPGKEAPQTRLFQEITLGSIHTLC